MTTPNNSFSLHDLLSVAANGTLTESQAQQLNALLLADPAARQAYVRHMHLEANLHHLLRESLPGPGDTQMLMSALVEVMEKHPVSHEETVAPPQPLPPKRPWRQHRRVWAVAAAVGLTAVLGLAVGLWRHQTSRPVEIAAATLTGAIDAQWADGAAFTRGAHLPAGTLNLQRGVVRLDTTHGVTVIVEAPAEFQIVSPTQLSLTRGALTAHVPPEGVGFTVVTDQARVKDLGTEFGVYVDLDSRTHADVFVGKVSMTPTAGGAARTIVAGNAAQVSDGAIIVKPVDNRPLTFLRPAQFDELAQAHGDMRYARWHQFSEELRQDPGTIAYYAFDEASLKAGKVLNTAPRRAAATDGELENASWGEGRFPGKPAVVFNGSSRIHIEVPGAINAMTLAEWFNPQNLHEPPTPHDHQFAAFMLSDGSRKGAVHWQVMDAQRLELGLGLADAIPVPFERYRSPDVLSGSDLDRWNLVAVVFDPSARQVRHYLNGQRVSISPIGDHPDLLIGQAQIGNWAEVGLHTRGLFGRVDELVILDRAMTSQEIETMYWAGGGD